MLPCLAVATNPSCRGPMRWLVCVNVAATFSRGGCRSISDSNFFSSGCADDLSLSMKRFSAALTCSSSAGVGRGIATSGGTGAGGPITTGAKPPRPAPGGPPGATPGACADAAPTQGPMAKRAMRTITRVVMA